MPVTAYNTVEDLYAWDEGYQPQKMRKSYNGGQFSSESILAMNMAMIIAIAQEQKGVVESQNLVHKDVFEVCT